MAASIGETVSTTTHTLIARLDFHTARLSNTTLPLVSYILQLLSLVLNKYCVPDLTRVNNATLEALTNFTNYFNQYFNVDKLTNYVTDCINVWQVLAYTIGTAFVIGMIYMIFIRCFAGVLVWLTIFSIMAILGGGGYWVWTYRNHYE
jgi:hypothetical protein